MVKGISKLVMDLTVRLTCVKGKVKSDSRFDLSFAKDQMCSKSNFSSRACQSNLVSRVSIVVDRQRDTGNEVDVNDICFSNIRRSETDHGMDGRALLVTQ